MNTLYGIFYSPWTQRARWALDHHGVVYRYREHAPMLKERALARRARKAGITGTATVPLLITASGGRGDSWAIIRYADEIGSGASLRSTDPAIAAWVEELEPLFAQTRVRVTGRTLRDRKALTEAAATAVPGFLAPLARPVAAMGARYLARKYAFDPTAEEDLSDLRGALDRVRAQLDGGDYLFEGFSAADIVTACLLNGVQPHSSLPFGPATFAAWHVPALAEAYADLIGWRDRLFAAHR